MADDRGSDINGYLVASMAGPVKRKRGRPRKNPLPVDDAAAKAEVVRARDFQPLGTVRIDEGELAFDYQSHKPGPAVKVAAGREGVEGPTEWPVVKRKRGRPRKEPLPVAGVSTRLTGLLALEPGHRTGVIGRGDAPVIRGSGRPRKNPLPTVEAPIAPIGRPKPELMDAGAVAEPIVAPIKRKAGRPRKNPLAGIEVSPTPLGGSVIGLVGDGIVAEQVAGPGFELATGAGQGKVVGLAPGPVIGPVKRKPGRPRKHPLPEPERPGRTALMPVSGAPAPGLRLGGTGIRPARPDGNGLGNPDGTKIGLVDRYGIGPGNKEGIGFWPPRPEEIESVKTAAIEAGLVTGRKRGRKKKLEAPAENAPGKLGERAFGLAAIGARTFCGKCGTYTRLFRPATGPCRRVCPKCHPGKMLETRRPGVNLDRTGMPCKDRGKCRPERCVMAFDCEEMKRLR